MPNIQLLAFTLPNFQWCYLFQKGLDLLYDDWPKYNRWKLQGKIINLLIYLIWLPWCQSDGGMQIESLEVWLLQSGSFFSDYML